MWHPGHLVRSVGKKYFLPISVAHFLLCPLGVSDLHLKSTDQEIAREVLQYLAERPSARDTVGAIAEWWVRRRRLEETVRTVHRVVRQLVKDGLILEYEDPPGFGVNPKRIDEITGFINMNP